MHPGVALAWELDLIPTVDTLSRSMNLDLGTWGQRGDGPEPKCLARNARDHARPFQLQSSER